MNEEREPEPDFILDCSEEAQGLFITDLGDLEEEAPSVDG
jgi:hypothetical protein